MISEKLHMILRPLHRQGWSISALAREFDINWRTAQRYALVTRLPCTSPGAGRPISSRSSSRTSFRRLEVCSSCARHDALSRGQRARLYVASYPSFARRARILRKQQDKETVVRFETDPGVQMQIDWAELEMWPLGDGTVELTALVVGILGFSRHVAMRFATEQTRASTLSLVPWVLHELGGADRRGAHRPGQCFFSVCFAPPVFLRSILRDARRDTLPCRCMYEPGGARRAATP